MTVPQPHRGCPALGICDGSVTTISARHLGLTQCHVSPLYNQVSASLGMPFPGMQSTFTLGTSLDVQPRCHSGSHGIDEHARTSWAKLAAQERTVTVWGHADRIRALDQITAGR